MIKVSRFIYFFLSNRTSDHDGLQCVLYVATCMYSHTTTPCRRVPLSYYMRILISTMLTSRCIHFPSSYTMLPSSLEELQKIFQPLLGLVVNKSQQCYCLCILMGYILNRRNLFFPPFWALNNELFSYICYH